MNGLDYTLQDKCSQLLRDHSCKQVASLLSSSKFMAEMHHSPKIEPCTLLHIACSLPSVSQNTVSSIIEIFPNACRLVDEDGNLPIHNLCANNPIRPDLIKLLLLACPVTSFAPFEGGEATPISALLKNCVQMQGVEATLELISAMPSDVCFNQKTSVLHQVCNELLPEKICHYLINRYPDICRIQNNGNTLLHIMCSHEQSTLSLVESILAVYPEACSTQDDNGNLPLHLVNSKDYSLGIIRVLVQCFPQGKLVQNFSGKIPLMSPSIRCSSMRVKELLRNKFPETSDVLTSPLNTCNRSGMSPLTDFYFSLQRQVTDLMFQGQLSMGELASFGMTSNYTKHTANNLESIFYAMRAAVYNSVDYSLNTPHHVSFWVTFPLFTKVLLNHCPELAYHQDCLGFFPLHIIARHSLQQMGGEECIHCNTRIYGPHFLYQNDTHCCSKCAPCFIAPNGPACLVEYQGSDLIKDVLAIYPQAAKIKDPHGSYALHQSIKSGKTWSTGVRELVDAAPSVLGDFDEDTNCYPFMLASVEQKGDEGLETGDKLATIFELLRRNPSHIK